MVAVDAVSAPSSGTGAPPPPKPPGTPPRPNGRPPTSETPPTGAQQGQESIDDEFEVELGRSFADPQTSSGSRPVSANKPGDSEVSPTNQTGKKIQQLPVKPNRGADSGVTAQPKPTSRFGSSTRPAWAGEGPKKQTQAERDQKIKNFKDKANAIKDFVGSGKKVDPKKLADAGQRFRENPRDVGAALDMAENIPELAPYIKGARLAEKFGGIDEQELLDAVKNHDGGKLAEIAAKASARMFAREVALNFAVTIGTAALIGLFFLILIAAICKLNPLGIAYLFNSVCSKVNTLTSYAPTIDTSGNGPIIKFPAPVSPGCVAKESGGCTKATISACPEMAAQMDAALEACNQESSGGKVAIASGTDKCQLPDGSSVSFSWGLWQLNIVAGSTGAEFPECKGVLKQGAGPWGSLCLGGTCGRQCSYGPGGSAAFNRCTAALADPVRNTRQACALFRTRGWKPWPYTRTVCALP